ncbi:uncharacterized protein VTP21DRAFT_5197 [Calcarisporiella thermophila]|uniref:uncharacterized protein n=1 Tax=Calcarisporiella thermophila TaxID=911321 RepID=UPI003741F975
MSSEAIAVGGGYVVQRVVPDDNNCLFRSVDPSVVAKLRKLVADCIRKDTDTYSEAFLGKPVEEYCNWIMKESWGGAIELSILSKVYGVEIASIDIQTGRVDRFGEGEYAQRVILLYSGIHYDAVAMTPDPNAPREFDQTQFEVSDDAVLPAALQLAARLREKRQYTDLANFTLRCSVCQTGLRGQKEATQHALQTGHASFEEYLS